MPIVLGVDTDEVSRGSLSYSNTSPAPVDLSPEAFEETISQLLRPAPLQLDPEIVSPAELMRRLSHVMDPGSDFCDRCGLSRIAIVDRRVPCLEDPV